MDTRIHAAIDLGSNSAKITVACVRDDTIETIANESTMIRLGESVNTTGQITPEKEDAVITTLQKYQGLTEKYEASSIIVVATEAVRKARNCAAFLNAVQQETGLTVHTVSGEIEAALTYLGATSDQQGVSAANVVDIGGGSTELILAQQGHIQWLISLPIGSGWLHDHYLSSDPPATTEADQARTFLTMYLHQLQLPEMPPTGQAHNGQAQGVGASPTPTSPTIATGSSAKSLLALSKQALKVAKEKHVLNRYDLLGCFGLLSALPAAEIARRYEQPLERARVLPGGALILLALLDFLQLEEIAISQRGVSEGALLAALKYGDNWLEHPDVKVDPSRIGQAPAISDLDEGDKSATASQLQNEIFTETGRRELQQRSEKFVKWIDPVLENKDIEDVHKMRVASRRLRATLDAYESVYARRPFQRVYREVKQAADLLGTARDTDVMLLHLEQQQQQVPDNERPGIQWLISRLQSYRERQQREIAAFFKDFQSKRFKHLVTSCIPDGVSDRGKS
jgi:exopolyphosphatase/pppGpp-phosphohydrolase